MYVSVKMKRTSRSFCLAGTGRDGTGDGAVMQLPCFHPLSKRTPAKEKARVEAQTNQPHAYFERRGDEMRDKGRGEMCGMLLFVWGLTVVGDGRQDLCLDVLQGEPVAGPDVDALGDDGLACLLRLHLGGVVRRAAVEEVLAALGVLDVLDADVDALPSDAPVDLQREKRVWGRGDEMHV
jgi:hypothetical protein